MNKKIISSILIIVLLILNCVMSYATTDTENDVTNNTVNSSEPQISQNKVIGKEKYKIIVEDDADLLTEDEEIKLYTQMKDLAEYGNIIFKSIKTNNTTADQYAKTYYNGQFGSESGTVFLVDMKNRKIYIFSNGANYNVITNEKAEVITDNIYQYATNKEYYKCATEAFSQMKTLLEGGKIAEPMKYISNGVIAVMLALLINFGIFKVATTPKAASDSEQIDECEKLFEHTPPEVKSTGTHREYSPVSDSSSGGSSGGGSSGGGRRRSAEAGGGGGGGHSF